MRKLPKIITGVLFWGLVCVPVSGFAEKNTNLPQNPSIVSGSANFNKDGNTDSIGVAKDVVCKRKDNSKPFDRGKDCNTEEFLYVFKIEN